MITNSREGTLHLDREAIQGALEQKEYEWSQAAQSVHETEPGRSSTGLWATAIATMQTLGYAFRQLVLYAAPAGESNFKRQML